MSNDSRVHREISSAAKSVARSPGAAEAIEQTAKECFERQLTHKQVQMNINQQFEQLLRELGAKLGAMGGQP